MRDRHITCLSPCTSTVLAAAAVAAVAALPAAGPIAAAAAAKALPAAAAGEAAAAPTATAVAAVAALPPAAAGRYRPNMSATGAGGDPPAPTWQGPSDPTSVSRPVQGQGAGGAPGRLRVPPRCQDDLGALRLLGPPRPRPASRPAAPQALNWTPGSPASRPPGPQLVTWTTESLRMGWSQNPSITDLITC